MSCGPDWPEAVFVKHQNPDGPYQDFAAGKLGVPQPDFRVRHLVVLYNYLSNRPLTPAEQHGAVDVDTHFNSNWEGDERNFVALHPGYEAWLKVRLPFGDVDGYTPVDYGKDQQGPVESYFATCLQDAFTTAAQTLTARAASYGQHSPGVQAWVQGQDAVFQTCAKQDPAFKPLDASAPAWLKQDRAYQVAASRLYLHHYDEAVAGFREVAADTHSPWSPLAQYLVARVLVTEAVNMEGYYFPTLDSSGKPAAGQPTLEQRRAHYFDRLHEAYTLLTALHAKPELRPELKPYRHAIDALLDRVAARLDPQAQTRVLAARLTGRNPDPNFQQDLTDFTILENGTPFLQDEDFQSPRDNKPADIPRPDRDLGGATAERADDLIAFVDAMHAHNRAASVTHWHKMQTTPWLVASLALSTPGDPGVPELLEAARTIQPSSPAWTAVTYYRLRLGSDNAVKTRESLLAILPQLQATSPTRSTTNLFLTLEAQTAPEFETWLKHAARLPAAEEYVDENEGFVDSPAPVPCSNALPDAETALFDRDAATVLNTRIPLRLLIAAAQSSTLPPHLRFTVAQSAWTRAVLLNRPADASKLTPILERCSPLWQPVLEAYDHSKTATDREAAALLALMRFPSVEPNVREGNLRIPGFPLYSEYRDNWWRFTVRDVKLGGTPGDSNNPGIDAIPDPAFLTAKDRREAADEYASLHRVPDAPTYFFTQVAAWQRAHPHDPRTPELLGEAFRVARNGNVAPAPSVAKDSPPKPSYEEQLYLLLHHNYPNSSWAQRYTVWDKNGN